MIIGKDTFGKFALGLALAGGIVAVTDSAFGAFTFGETSAMTYDGAGADSGIDPYTENAAGVAGADGAWRVVDCGASA